MFRFPIRFCLLLALLLVAVPFFAQATTWNEPWHEQVVRQADVFVLARVTGVDEQKGIQATVLRTLAGNAPADGPILIDNFYLLDICSTSGGHGPEFYLGDIDTCYFFLKQNQAGHYSLATPTTGFAPVRGQQVSATYRHSYHQAIIGRPVYELTMTAIFQHYHGQPYEAAPIQAYIDEQLAAAPAGLDAAGMDAFFRQHVALETVYHLGLPDYYTQLLPFLHDAPNFHAQTSAARALTSINTPAANQELLGLLKAKSTEDFVKVMAVRALAAHQPKALKSELTKLSRRAPEESISFGGNIMDPRICTHLPSVKKALTDLINGL